MGRVGEVVRVLLGEGVGALGCMDRRGRVGLWRQRQVQRPREEEEGRGNCLHCWSLGGCFIRVLLMLLLLLLRLLLR